MKRFIALLLGVGMLLTGLAACGDAAVHGVEDVEEPGGVVAPHTDEPSAGEPQQEPAAEPAEEPEPEPVNNDWEFAAPEDYGVDSAYFTEIHRKIAGSQMYGMVTVKDGVIIDEFYQDGYDKDSVFRMHSVTKSVSGALIGIAIEQGILKGVDTPLAEFYPDLIGPDDDGKDRVTIAHLLAHTSGIGRGDSETFASLMAAENWVEYYLSLPMSAEPGTVFHYTTAGSHMLAAVLERAAGMSANDYAHEYLFGPIGMESVEWGTDPQGITDGGNGLAMSLRDAARFGLLYLDEGSWRGRQIIPREWVAESTKVHAAGEPDKGEYGYQWWIQSFGEGGVYSGYYALGYAGQFVLVVPELGLVTAIASKSVWSDYTGQVCFEEIVSAFAG